MTMVRIFPICSLLLILAVGILFRAPGVYWGNTGLKDTGFTGLHPDEVTHINIASTFIDKDTTIDKMYIMGYGFQIASLAFLTKGLTHEPTTETDLYFIGRWLSFAYGLASIVLLFFIVQTLSNNSGQALLSALFLSLCSLAVTNSHYAVADAAALFWIMLVCYLSFTAITTSSQTRRYGAWIAGGFAISIKISICVAAPLIAMVYFLPKRIINLLLGLFTLFCTIMMANGLALGPNELQGIWQDIFSGNMSIIPHHSMVETLATILISSIPAFSLPIVLLALFYLPATLQKCKQEIQAFTCFALPTISVFIILLMSDLPFERHLLPFAPVFCGLAASAWYKINNANFFRKQVLWTLPLVAYLIFFVIDGEMPFWQENRNQAKIWLENNIEPGRTVYLSQYAGSLLSRKKYTIVRRNVTEERLKNIEAIVLHEAHTYRYKRSRLSPFVTPAKNNIYHDQSFYLDYLDPLEQGKLPFTLAAKIQSPGNWALERSYYKKYWGTFTSFVGDIWIYQNINAPKA